MNSRKEDILKFLQKVDKEFRPALSEKTSLEEYADKVCSLAELVIAEDDRGVYGLTVIYCNDKTDCRAHIALVGVVPEYQGKGIGRMIIDTLEQDEFFLRAKRVYIHSAMNAIKFYQKMGYDHVNGEIVIDEDDSYMLEKFR
jgi:N-acetylglutamate synthase-like GNAT family acetyltransferase